MYLNVEKTKVIMFGTEKKLRQGSISIQTNDGQLGLVRDLKCLAVILESSLKWTKQVDSVVVNISRIIGIIRRIKYFITKRNSIDLYFSLILPYIDYCSMVWGNTCKTNLNHITKSTNQIC